MRTLLTAKRHTASHVSPGAKWQQAVSSTTWPHLPFISAKAVYSCSIKFFHLKRALGLALGELGPCLRNHRKTLVSVSRIYLCLFPWESFSRHTLFISMCGKTEQISLVRNKDAVRYRLNSDCCMTWQFFCASFGMSFCRGNEHHGIDPSMSNSGHHDCSTKAVFLCRAGNPPLSITDFNIRCHLT